MSLLSFENGDGGSGLLEKVVGEYADFTPLCPARMPIANVDVVMDSSTVSSAP